MKRLSTYLAGAAIIAVLLTLAAPRAVQAVTAALVNVTNTAASPAIGQSVSQLASQNVVLYSAVQPGTSHVAARFLPDGSASLFAVPAGQSLVVTTIEIQPSVNAGIYYVNIVGLNSGALRKSLSVPGAYTNAFQYPSGLVFPPGESVQIVGFPFNPNDVGVTLHGYLTSN
jgi:hypothetical protein